MRPSFNNYFTVFLFFFVCACNQAEDNKADKINASASSQSPVTPGFHSYYLMTFVVKNEAGEVQGWGYDIYADSVKTIHQAVIPAVSGIRSFKTEKDAERTGNYAISKMKINGSFPTLSIHELDSLGVTK